MSLTLLHTRTRDICHVLSYTAVVLRLVRAEVFTKQERTVFIRARVPHLDKHTANLFHRTCTFAAAIRW